MSWEIHNEGGEYRENRDLEQVHLLLGFPSCGLMDRDYYAANLLSTLLGGGMSSRLFQEVREKRGLAYSIYSYLSSFSDSGTLTVYAATSPREAPRVAELACREIRRLRSKGLTHKELERAKNQMRGGLMLGLESTHSRMSKLANDELHQGRHCSFEQMLADIAHVSESQTLRVAQEILDLNFLSVTALGPLSPRSLHAIVS